MKKLLPFFTAPGAPLSLESSLTGNPINFIFQKIQRPALGLLVVLFLMGGVGKVWGQTPTDGDYRTRSTGALTWSGTTTWQVRAGFSWSNTTNTPTSAANVYIQAGSTVTVDVATADCKDLHINSAAGSVVALGSNTLQVSGKIRAYTGTAVFTAGADGTFYSGQLSTSTVGPSCISSTSGAGKLKFIGSTRTLCNTGEWGNDPQAWDSEFAPTSGQILTIQTGFKSRNVTISSGTIVSSAADFRPDGGASGTGTLTVKSGTVLRFTGNTINIKRVGTAGSTSHFSTLTVESGATLDFSGTSSPTIGASTFVFSGIVSYSGSGTQTLAAKGGNSGGSDPNTYTNVTLAGSSAKTTLASLTTSISGTLSIQGTASLALGTSALLSYGGSATLEYASSTSNQTTTNAEFPVTGGPPNISINNTFGGTGVTLDLPKTILGNLNLIAGNLNDGGFQFSVGGNISGTSTHSGAGKITMTGGGKTISGCTLGNLEIAGTISAAAPFSIAGDLTLTSGSLADGGNVITLAGGIAGTGSHTSTGSGKILMTGSGKFIGGVSLGNLYIQSGASINLAVNATVNGDFNLGGSLAGAGLILTVGGNITGTGTQTNTTGKILMTGTSKTISGATLGNLELNGSGFSLTGSPIINGTLTFTSGKISLGAFDLTTSTITGATSARYVVTDGAGVLKMSSPATVVTTFPVGSSTTSYDEVTLKPTTTSVFSVKVKPTTGAGDFPGTIVSYGNVAPRVWDIAVSGTPGSTQVTFLNGNSGLDPGGTAVVGHYSGSWTEIPATYNTNVWTGFTSTFSPFGVGKAGAFVDPCAGFTSLNTDYFRSKQSGNWSDASTWESSHDNSVWCNATLAPDANANAITIRNPNNVTISSSVIADQLSVNPGGSLTVNASQTLTILDGPGTDLQAFQMVVNGTLIMNGILANIGTVTINGTFQMNQGSSISAFALAYGSTGTLVYAGTSTQTVTNLEWPLTNGPFNVVSNNSVSVNLSANRTITGSLTLSSGILNISSFILAIGGNLHGTAQASTTTGTLKMTGFTRNIDGNVTLGDLEVDGLVNVIANITTQRLNLFNFAGVMVSSPYVMTVQGNLDSDGGILYGTGKVKMSGGGGRTISLRTLCTLELDNVDGFTILHTATITGDLIITQGTFNDGGNIIQVTGNVTGAGSHTGGGQISMTGTAVQLSVANVGNLRIDGTITTIEDITVNGDLTLTTGSLSDGGHTITLLGNLLGNGTHTFTGFGEIKMTGTNKTISGATLGNLELNNAAGFLLTGSPTINNLIINQGHLTLDAFNCTTETYSGGTGNYVITDGVGKLRVNIPNGVGGTYVFIGPSASSMNVVGLDPTSTSLFDFHVKPISVPGDFSHPVNNFSLVKPVEWDIEPVGTPGSTGMVLFYDSPAPGSPVIGHYTSGAWEELPASFDIGNYTATVNSFSPFGVGTATGFIAPCDPPVLASEDYPLDENICENSGVSMIGYFNGSDLAFQWQVSTDGGMSWNDVPNAAPYGDPTLYYLAIYPIPLSFNGYQYRKVATNSCGSAMTNPATLTVHEQATVDAGPVNQIACSGWPYQLNGEFGGSATSVTWTSTGDGSFSNPNDPDAKYTLGASDINAGNVILRLTTNDPAGPCNAAFEDIYIQIYQSPVITCPLDVTVCSTLDTYYFMGANPTNGEYSGEGVTDNAFHPSSLSIGTYTITYIYTTNVGCADTCTFSVTTTGPTPADAGTYPTYCASGDALSIPINGTPAGGFWVGSVGGAAPIGDQWYLYPYIGANPLTYYYTNAAGCISTDTTTIFVYQTPYLGWFPASNNICTSQPVFPVTDYFYPFPSGGTFTGPGVDVDGNFHPADVTLGSNIITYTINDEHGCTASTTQEFYVIEGPVATAGMDATVCGNSYQLNGSTPPLVGFWTQIDGPDYSYFMPDPNTPDAIVTAFNYGNYKYTWTVYDSTCADVDTINISFLQPLFSSCFGPMNICVEAAPFAINNAYPGGGVYTGTGVDEDGMFDPSVGLGDYDITYTLTGDNGCISSCTFTISVTPAPVANAGPDALVCGLSYNLNPMPTIGLGQWGFISGPGSANFSPDQYSPYATVSVNVAGTYVFWWTEYNSGCFSFDYDTLTFQNILSVSCPDGFTVCLNDDPVALSGGMPEGGSYSGDGVTENIFHPSVAGPGDHTITYSVLNPNGCYSTCTFVITVNNLPNISYSGMPLVHCLNGPTWPLTSVYDSGTWSGDGITDHGDGTATFDPVAAGVGFHLFYYSYTDANGCTKIATDADIVNPIPTASTGSYGPACSSDPDIALDGGTPSSGVWTGTGVSGNQDNGYVFDPGAGTQTLIYTVSNEFGCSDTAQTTIIVNEPPMVMCPANVSICSNTNPIYLLTGGTPAGGEYTGLYVAGGNFLADAAFPGDWEVTYTYTDPMSNCSASCTFTITVFDPPSVAAGTYDPVCMTAPDVMLTNGTPAGGAYSGTGVSGNVMSGFVFNPSVGSNTITYSYTDPVSGCTNSDNTFITVLDTAALDLGIYPPVCVASPDITLGGSPSGGTWTGTGVSGNVDDGFIFDPTVGTQTLTYTYINDSNCTSVGTVTIVATENLTITCPEDFTWCLSGGLYDLSSLNILPAGGSFSGAGVTGTFFDPEVAGVGATEITYSYNYGDGCSGLCTFTITVLANLVGTVDGGAYLTRCEDYGAVNLGGTPSGGVWTGNSVFGSQMDGYVFYTYSGSQTLTYTVTGANSCAVSVDVYMPVNPLPQLQLTDIDTCLGAAPFLLYTAGPPSNGTYFGPGVTTPQGLFDPALLGPGDWFPTYTVTDNHGCTSLGSFLVSIFDSPVTTCPTSPIMVSENDPAFLLQVSTPYGGTYSGTGVTFNYFDPAVAGVGTHTIVYNYTIGNVACVASCEFQIMVESALTCPPDLDVCLGDDPIDLNTLVEMSGTFMGTGVTDNIFDPLAAGVGSQTITYTLGENSCTFVINVNKIPVVTNSPTNQTGCENGSITFTSNFNGAGPSTIYTWQEQVDGMGTWTDLTEGSPYNNVQSNILTINPAPLSLDGNRYRLKAMNGCGTDYSADALLTLNPQPACLITGPTNVCPGDTGVVFSAPAGMASYSWNFANDCFIESDPSAQSITVTTYNICGSNFTIFLTVTDASGCSQACQLNGTLNDNEAPHFTACPAATISLGCNPDPITMQQAIQDAGIATDNCHLNSVMASGGMIESGEGCSASTQTWTVTAYDNCGNSSTCEVNYSWTTDTIAPAFTSCPTEPIYLGCNPGVQNVPIVWTKASPPFNLQDYGTQGGLQSAGFPDWMCGAKSTPLTGNFTLTYVIELMIPGPFGEIMFGYGKVDPSPTAILSLGNDPNGKLLYAQNGFSLHKYTASSFWISSPNANINPGTIYTVTISRNGPVIFYSITGLFGSNLSGAIEIGYTGNVYPAIAFLNNGSRLNSAFVSGPDPDHMTEAQAIAGAGEITDNCSIASVSAVGGDITGDCLKTQTWTITATDGCGNSSVCEPTYTWSSDNVAPVISCAPGGDLGCNPTDTDMDNYPDALPTTATYDDACSGPGVSGNYIDLAIDLDGCQRSLTRRFFFTDACGNQGTCESTFTWNVDTQLPVITCPINTDLGCNPLDANADLLPDAIPLSLAYTDNCSGNGNTTLYNVTASDNVGCQRSVTIDYYFTDACNNTGHCLKTFTWTFDVTGPQFLTCPGTLSLGQDPPAITSTQAILAAGTVTDDCTSTTVSAVGGPITGTCTKMQTWTVTATDACGNTGVCSIDYNWTVTPPVAMCPIDFTLNLEDLPFDLTQLTYSPTGGTFSGGGVDNNIFNTEEGGNHVITYGYTVDACTGYCTFNLFLQVACVAHGGVAVAEDETVCIGTGTTLSASGYSSGFGQSYEWEKSTDNMMWTNTNGFDPTTYTTGTLFTTTYYRLRVQCPDNSTDYSNVVTITVPANPSCSITGPGPACPESDVMYSAPMGLAGYVWALGAGSNGAIVGSNTQSSVTIHTGAGCTGIFTVFVTVTDANGCSSVCGQGVAVNDVTPPTFVNCPVATIDLGCQPTDSNNDGIPDAVATSADWTDNCTPSSGTSTTFLDIESFLDGFNRTLTRKFFYTDPCNNLGSCQITYAWTFDSEAPAFTCPEDLTLCANTEAFNLTELTYSPAGASFSGPTVEDNIFFPSAFGPGDAEITMTNTTENGCFQSCTFTIHVNENPLADGGPGSTVCGGLTGNLNAILPMGTTGQWSFVSGSGTVTFSPNDTDPNVTVTADAHGFHSFLWTVTDGICSAESFTSINFQSQPLCNAGPDGASCDLTYHLDGSVNFGPVTWSQVSGPGTSSFSNVHALKPIVTVSTYGTYQFKFRVQIGACFDEDFITVTFNQTVPLTCPGDDNMCSSEPPLTLAGLVTPLGGTYKVDGITATVFNPATESTGLPPHLLTYTYTTQDNCVSSCSWQIYVDQYPTVSAGTNGSACGFEYTLLGVATPGNVQWTATGPGMAEFINANSQSTLVTVDTYGEYTFTITVTNGVCSPVSSQVTINFIEQQYPVCQDDFAIYVGADPVTLTSTPAGGTYTGSGIVGNTFDPEGLTPGVYTISYAYVNPGCPTQQCTFDVSVTSYQAICPEDFGVCITRSPVPLNGGTPDGGVFSGPGVNMNIFDPVAAGLGPHSITYTYNDGSGESSCQFVITVGDSTVVDAGTYGPLCQAETISIAGTPAGGVFFGYPGVYEDEFGNWTLSASGSGTLSYGYFNEFGCFSYDVTPITTISPQCPPDQHICQNDAPITFAGMATPGGGVYQVNGVPATGFNPGTAHVGLPAYVVVYHAPNCFQTCTWQIIVDAVPNANAGSGGDACGLGFNLHSFPVYSGMWSMTSGPMGSNAIFADASNHDTQVNVDIFGTYVFRWTEINGSCSNFNEVTVNFYDVPAVTCPFDFSLCVNSGLYDLNNAGALPAGGTFSGTGVDMMNQFDPSVADVGMTTITYTYYNPMTMCSNSCTFNINVLALPTVDAGDYGPVCINAPDVTLSGTPFGGTWSGTGVTGDEFNPSASTQTLTYSYTDMNGCTGTDMTTIVVNPLPVITGCPPFGVVEVCLNFGPYNLLGLGIMPTGGIFSGTGVTGNSFDPTVGGPGNVPVSYTYNDPETGCSSTCNFVMQVDGLPTVMTGSYGPACSDGANIPLNGGNYLNGMWSGTGVSGNQMTGYVFDPSAGTQLLTYTAQDGNGCSNSAQTTIIVNPIPDILCPDDFSVNLADIPFTLLTGLFSNGNYSGDGISANLFSPADAGLGMHLISHIYTDGNGCTNSCSFELTVTPAAANADTSTMHWVFLPPGTNGTCVSNTDCCTNVFCYGLEYTPEFTGDLTNYTSGFITNCVAGSSPVLSNTSCIMTDNSFESDDCAGSGMVLFDDSGFDGLVPVTAGVPLIIHQVCFLAPVGATITVLEDTVTDLSTGINLAGGGFVTDYPQYDDTLIISRTPPVLPPFDSSYVECDASAVAPTPPVVSDMCGNNITPTGPVISGTYAGCEGTHVFTYTYTDCAGQSSIWKYTYYIDHITNPSEFGGPVPTSTTVSGTVNAVPPTLPVVKDVCGVTLTGSLLSMVDTPDPIICAGTRVYTYRFADCSGLNYDWVFTYTINNHTVLTCPEPIIACITDPSFALTGESPAGGTYSGTGVSGDVMTGFMFDPATAGAGIHLITYTYTNTYNCTDICTFNITVNPESGCNVTSSMTWVFLPPGQNGSCTSNTDCCSDILCYGLQYTPGYTGALTSYTTGFFANCLTGMSPVLSNTSCVMNNNSFEIGECNLFDLVLFNSSGNSGDVPVTAGVPLIIHQVCFSVPVGSTLTVSEDEATDLATSIDLAGGGFATEFPEYSDVTITRNPPVLPADGLSTVQCLSSVVDPGAPTGIIDQCGNQLTGVLTSTVDSPDPLICEGTRTYTYSFTDCSGQISDWHYVYTIEHSTSPSEIGGTVSTSGGTVECVSAVSPPVTLPVIKDVCGNTLTPTVASPEIGGTYTGCEGTFTFTYHYFDCAGLPFSWTYTYNIDHTTSPTEVGGPVSTSGGTVECISAATPPAILPLVKDVCGNTLSPTIASPLIGGTYTGCEGTYTYTYNYNDCSGLPFSWTYTYTIDHTTNPSEVGGPVSTSGGTVECISAATPPAILPVVKDVCGNTLSPDIDSPVSGGSYSGCEGTYTYTYTYSDCSGLPFSWTYTYTIDHTTNPSEVGGPVSTTGGTVECISAATAPAILPVVKDVCGNTLSPTIASPVIGGTYTGCEGTYTYTYNYSDCSGLPFSWTYTYTIDHTTNPAEVGGPVSSSGGIIECVSAATAPATLPVVKDVCGNTLSPLPGSPLIGGTYSGCEGTYTYTYNYSDCSGLPFSWTYTYTIDHTTNPAEFGGPVSTNGGTIECASAATAPATLPVVKDVCGNTLSPTIASPLIGGTYTGCEGTYTYTYNYSDCSGLPFSWTYTYTIDHTTNPAEVGGPVSTSGGTVECISAATAPLTLPVVKDVCGNTLSPTIASPLIGGTYTGCEGTYTYTYNYSDCSGLPFSWTFTYTIDHTTNPTEIGGPVSTSGGTVACANAATAPVILPVIKDVCGNTLTPTITSPVIGGTYTGCEGTYTYTYNYTDCSGLPFSWTYTYTIEREDFTIPPPGATTVSCPTDININLVTPPSVTDNCGNTLTPSGPTGPVNSPNPLTCGGTMTYTWTYTDCEGNMHAWNYVYTINCQSVTLKVYLEGPYDTVGDSMFTKLNTSHILPGQNTTLPFVPDTPSGQPYSGAPWNYNGTTGLMFGDPPYGTVPYPKDVVDWVLVTVRKDSIKPTANIWRCAGWVHKNGEVTFPENCPFPVIDNTSFYYIMVEHRNHLGVMTPGFPLSGAEITCGGLVLHWDFTTADSYKPPFRTGEKFMDGIWAMLAANGDQNPISHVPVINSSDYTIWRSQQNTLGYKIGDFNLNVSVNSADETVWKVNQNKTSGIIFY